MTDHTIKTETLALNDPIGRLTGNEVEYTTTFDTYKYARLLSQGAEDSPKLVGYCTARLHRKLFPSRY